MFSLLRCAAALLAVSFPLSACIVGPTNPWDDSAPPEIQVKGTLSGAAAYPSVSGEAPRPPDGIKVSVSQPGSEEALVITTSADDDGAFRFEVPPGNWTVRAEHPAFAAASVGPVRVSAGDDIAVDTLVLRLPNATSSLSGRVVAQGGLSAQGVEVSLLHDAALVGCGAVEAKTTTDESGAFLFDPVRPGRYVVVARTEGATLDMIAGEETLEISNDEEATLPRDLVIEPGTSVLEIESDGVLPSSTTRAADIVVHVRALAGMDEIQLGGDPTFDPSLGGTGWRPFQTETAFTLPPLEGDFTVFAQLRAGCVTSPLYAARVLYDPNPPEIVSAQVGTTLIDPLLPERPLAVVGAGQIGVPLTFTVIDESGVAAVRFSLLDGASTSTQTVELSAQPGQSVVRATADIPVEEGRYTLTVELIDVAGNVTPAELAPVVDVLRDVSAPTTPLPTVATLEVAGETALLWLEERDCPSGDRASVCEVNPHPDGLYRVRGGALTEFMPYAAPPFEVPLGAGASTTFEILAVDAAGYTSAGAGVIEVERHVPSVSFTAPINKELGPTLMPQAYAYRIDFETFFVDQGPGEPAAFYDEPALAATNGTAFFSLRPRRGDLAPHFNYLISQPADLPPVGTRWSLSPWPQGIRKLNHDCDDDFTCYDVYSRIAGGLGAGAGALTWMERISIGLSPQRPFRYVLFADADGRYDLRGPETSFNQSTFKDHENDPAPPGYNFEMCRTVGRARCSEEPWAWAPLNQVPPFATAFDGRRLVTAGASAFTQRITGADEGDVVITGPHVIATVLEPQPGYAKRAPPLLAGIGVRMAAPAGTVLYAAVYEEYDSFGVEWDPVTFDDYPDYGVATAHIASGTGEELILAPPSSFGFEDPIAVGVYIPAGVTVTVPRVSVTGDGFPYRPVGLIDRPATTDPTDRLDAETAYLDDPTRSLDLTLFLTERDRAGFGNVAGMSLYDLGADRAPTRTVLPGGRVADPAFVDSVADERLGQLVSTRTEAITLPTAAEQGALEVPAELCTLVVRPRFDVQLRAVTLEGQGRLDRFAVRVWERGGASAVGRYRPANLNPNDHFPAFELFESLDVDDSCSNTDGALIGSYQAAGQAAVEASSSDTVDVERPALAVLASRLESGVRGAGEFGVLSLDPPNDGLPVSPGQRVRVTMTGTTGDADLYLQWDAAPTRDLYDCRPYEYGSDEACDLLVPSGTSLVYVGVDGYEASNDYEVQVEVLESGFKQVASYPVVAGDLFRAALTATAGDPDLFLGIDAPPTEDSYDCRSIAFGDDACDLDISAAGSVYVAVLENDHPTQYQVTSSVLQPTIAEVGSYPVAPGDRLEVVLTSAAPAEPRVRFDDAGAWLPLDCEGDPGALTCTAQALGSSATLGVIALESPTDFDITVDVYRVGCGIAAAGDLSGGNNTLTGVLQAGRHYLITVGGGGFGQYHFEVEDDWPALYRGAPLSNAYLEVLGAASGARYAYDWANDDDSALVDAVDTSAPVCRLGLEVTPSVQYIRPAIGTNQSAAVRRVQAADGAVQATVVAARLAEREQMQALAPAAVSALPPRWQVAALGYFGDDLFWLEHDEEGRQAALMRAYAGVWPPGAACEVHAFPADVRVTAAAIDEGRLLVGGRFAGVPKVALYGVRDDGACGTLSELTSTATPRVPLTAVLDGNDAFLWRDGDGDDGGALLYFSARDLAPLYANDGERVLGFDARGGDVVFTVASTLTGEGRTLLVSADASTGDHVGARELVAGVRHHPRFVGGALALVRASAPDAEGRRLPEVVLRPLDEALFASVGEVVIASAGSYFAGMAPFDEADPEAWASEIHLDANGSTLAVLGKDADGSRRLAIFRVPADASSFGTLSPEHELSLGPAGPDPAVERLSVSDELVTITFRSALAPVVLRRDDTGATPTWQAVAVGTLDQERVLGVWQGQLLLMQYPGDIYAERSPQHVELFVRDVVTGLPAAGEAVTSIGRLPGESYGRTFSFVGPGVDGALALYDDSAASPVLWRLDERGFAVRDDGSHRPLTAGVEAAGPAGAPRSSGDALYFLRDQDGRMSLMRYRALD